MSIPTSAKIGPFTYRVDVNGQEAWEWNHNGRVFYRTRRISLNDLQPETEFPATLLHEILHALGEAYEIRYWVDHEKAAKLPEGGDQIDLMAKALLLFLRENTEIVDWLRGDSGRSLVAYKEET